MSSRPWPGSSTLWQDPAPLSACLTTVSSTYFHETTKGGKTEALTKDKGKEEVGSKTQEKEEEEMIGEQDATPHILSVSNKYMVKSQLRFIRQLLRLQSFEQSSFMRIILAQHRESPKNSFVKLLLSVPSQTTKGFASLYGLVMAIISQLLHNDPTCYGALSSLNFPQTLINALSSSVISRASLALIPQVLSAISLNKEGRLLVQKSGVLANVFKSLYLEEGLQSVDRGTMTTAANHFGGSLSEFIAHHPSLVDEVVKNAIDVLATTVKMFDVDMSEEVFTGLIFFFPLFQFVRITF